ncbi:YbjN domain-containing protein [Cellulosimicrobium sp. Marseille-Q4280]|uniref:YbjN domain-containing protein n=1 Tax=Cellulosimicrobium sp. Marseille-Q4280 TaxID=2937992 RepID=UPI00203C2517|nr:YbjN domain-containing protein [Cellulosimicrobium sp. Marseille-Q4280]
MRFFGERDDDRREDEPGGISDDAGTGRLDDDALRSQVEDLLARELGQVVTADDRAPSPLALPRVVEWITDSGYSYFVDSDGDVGGLWHGRLFYFLLFGNHDEILQVRGQWNRDLAIERLEEVLEFCNEWNADRIWPKTYTRVRDNGMIQVFTEVTVDLEHGVTDDQLDQLLQCGLSTGSMFFDALDEFYPDPARQAP